MLKNTGTSVQISIFKAVYITVFILAVVQDKQLCFWLKSLSAIEDNSCEKAVKNFLQQTYSGHVAKEKSNTTSWRASAKMGKTARKFVQKFN